MRILSRLGAPSAPVVEQRLRAALADAGALLRLDTARLELVTSDVATGIAVVALEGRCPHCELSVSVFRTAVEARVRQQVPEVRELRLTGD